VRDDRLPGDRHVLLRLIGAGARSGARAGHQRETGRVSRPRHARPPKAADGEVDAVMSGLAFIDRSSIGNEGSTPVAPTAL
jgi:hypothetical protein